MEVLKGNFTPLHIALIGVRGSSGSSSLPIFQLWTSYHPPFTTSSSHCPYFNLERHRQLQQQPIIWFLPDFAHILFSAKLILLPFQSTTTAQSSPPKLVHPLLRTAVTSEDNMASSIDVEYDSLREGGPLDFHVDSMFPVQDHNPEEAMSSGSLVPPPLNSDNSTSSPLSSVPSSYGILEDNHLNQYHQQEYQQSQSPISPWSGQQQHDLSPYYQQNQEQLLPALPAHGLQLPQDYQNFQISPSLHSSSDIQPSPGLQLPRGLQFHPGLLPPPDLQPNPAFQSPQGSQAAQRTRTRIAPGTLTIDMDLVYRAFTGEAPSSPQRTTYVPEANIQLRRRAPKEKPKVFEYRRGDVDKYLDSIEDPDEERTAFKAFLHSSKLGLVPCLTGA